MFLFTGQEGLLKRTERLEKEGICSCFCFLFLPASTQQQSFILVVTVGSRSSKQFHLQYSYTLRPSLATFPRDMSLAAPKYQYLPHCAYLKIIFLFSLMLLTYTSENIVETWSNSCTPAARRCEFWLLHGEMGFMMWELRTTILSTNTTFKFLR